MSKIVWQKSGMSDLTLEQGRTYPIQEPIKVYQRRYLTEAMNSKIVSYGSTASFVKLDLEGLSKDNYDGAINGIKIWFQDANINWSENSFTMIDERGVNRTVRLWQDTFDMQQDFSNRYSVSLLFKDET